jgi:hypothetical protein
VVFVVGLRQLKRAPEANLFGHSTADEFIQAGEAEALKHLARFGGAWADMPAAEHVWMRGDVRG